MKKILVTGSSGQLGSEIKELSGNFPEYEFAFATRDDFSLEDSYFISEYLESLQPNIIINCAAYTAVDKAESDQETAEAVNHFAVETMAKWSKKNNAKLIHVSTDYVFDGNSSEAISEDSPVNPINFYGASKLRGEEASVRENPDTIVIRTAWVYSEFGNNFVKTMLRLMQERESLNVVNDQIGSPTYARDLAEAILNILASNNWISGIYHYSNEGEISWFEFASAIKEIAKMDCKLDGIPSSKFPTPAKRPMYSLLDKSKIKETFGVQIPNYRESLQKCIKKIKA